VSTFMGEGGTFVGDPLAGELFIGEASECEGFGALEDAAVERWELTAEGGECRRERSSLVGSTQ
jgi:hypothetical protein